ncbi:HTTM domain-containing protein [Dyadobacter pollutisoli]|uniref:HTTM domain-containing protein n=1 Tax=Dyadobacter pollutisoli TaxID=2910158 RepID=A0A9E8SQ30_9BACT|nr:HTTM domain-containing protein [Dyadobacter pollutisoli]WAC15331.1 HTTM domain-containing protein [Dyadobacter pollutisoli]
MLPYFQKTTSAAPLAVLRWMLGIMLSVSLLRFWYKGWIDDLYIKPKYFFPFYGFEWVRPLGTYTYLLFAVCLIAAIFVAIGLFYRASIVTLFASFTYIELMDKSTYLNHYYFISLLCLLFIFLPAHVCFSVDAYRDKKLLAGSVPRWCVDAVKLLVFILYFYAGLAKLNSDWLLQALPLKIWLPARNDMPVIGRLFNQEWVPFVFSWFGCVYDLFIVFLLLNRKTRVIAYLTVVVFHLMTALLFPIGMFPYMMIVTALIFFSPEFHQRVIQKIGVSLKIPFESLFSAKTYTFSVPAQKLLITGFSIFFVFQLIFPFRYLLYPGELFWSEQGYRFSWRVMLMEKAGYVQFVVKDRTGKQVTVNNNEFLTILQEKMMSTQPDMILQYAHILRDFYAKHGFQSPQVYVDSYVTLNGRLGKPLIDPETDLAKQTESFRDKTWIVPLAGEIQGF